MLNPSASGGVCIFSFLTDEDVRECIKLVRAGACSSPGLDGVFSTPALRLGLESFGGALQEPQALIKPGSSVYQ